MSEHKIVLLGAGSASFTVGLVADLLLADLPGTWTVGLVDIDERALGVAEGLVRRMVEARGANLPVTAATDRADLLPGAEVVVSTIAVGGRRAWEADILIPRRHGIFQPVGDTVGAGGISRALRQIPALVDIARDVQRLCPQAFFFNYANPMAALVRAVNVATAAPAIGLCHGVQGTVRYLCQWLDVPAEEVTALYCGVNHLTWITHLTRGGESLWPLVDQRLRTHPPTDNPFAWELYRAHGAFPAVLDRHIVEFFSPRFAGGQYYGQKLGESVFDIQQVIHSGDDRYAHMVAQAEGREPLAADLFERKLGEHEALLPILGAIYHDRQTLFPMNVPNATVAGIPAGFVLEMPVAACRAGCLPVALPDLTAGQRAVVVRALYGVELTVEAARQGEAKLVAEALLYDGCVPDLAAAEALTADLLAAHRQHLPQFA